MISLISEKIVLWCIAGTIFVIISALRKNVFPFLIFSFFCATVLGSDFIYDEYLKRAVKKPILYLYWGSNSISIFLCS